MKTFLTSQDIVGIVDNIFNGNLWTYNASKGTIPYENENGEIITLLDENGTKLGEPDIAQYLNVKFYSWKNRLVEKGNTFEDNSLAVFDDWVQSLNGSMNEAYGLIERIEEEVVASPDIDSSVITSKISFLIQTDKLANLEYYVGKLRNTYLGQPQELTNRYGDMLRAFIAFGNLTYEEAPEMLPIGEVVVATMNFRISYLNDAKVFSDLKLEISFEGDDTYDTYGNIIDENTQMPTDTKYLTMPITMGTMQKIFTTNSVPRATRPDLSGFLATALSQVITLSFFDFNKELVNQFNAIFYEAGAFRKNGVLTTVQNVNNPVFLRVSDNENSYVYKMVIENMQKTFTNNEFNISSLSLKTWGKD